MNMTYASMARRAMVLLYLTAAACLTSGCGAEIYEQMSGETVFSAGGTALSTDAASEAETGRICVYVCGAVVKTGVYELDSGARVYEAVEAAGGLTDEADETALNQAAALADGQQLIVPVRAEYAPAAAPGSPQTAAPVNINTAGVSELTTLSGIGEAKARDIISYRERNGPFETAEDIMKVSGIKTSAYEKIRDAITVG